MTLETGTQLGPYEILGSLGAGGMGEVYRARDSRLRRDVAIKILPSQLADDPDALARFEREAQAIAAISHPNILAIFDIGRHEGITYTVTELLEGETLRQRMQRVNLSPKRVVEYAIQMGRGLAAAHERGVTHRDLKPENLFVTRDGLVKILDFGLAKQSAEIFGSNGDTEAMTVGQTAVGTIAGTLSYMSPEQLRGAEVDHRCDLFSFGTVVFEMLAGERPFRADSAPELMGAILRDDPPPFSKSGVYISPAVERVVERCLEKLPQERFQTARDLVFALEAISDFDQTTSSTEVVQLADVPTDEGSSVAVLPFANMSPDPEQEYFCEGMAEEIIRALAQMEGLRVAARASAFQFKGGATDIREVGQKLNVKTVLDGSVRTAGKRLRVTVQLVDAANGYELWTERYDREMEDVFAIQDEISESIVEALEDKLATVKKEEKGPAKRPTDSLEAYQAYLKGQHNWYKREKGSLARAAHFFEQAVELDPDYAEAHIRIALSYTSLAIYGMEPRLARQKSQPALERARVLAPDLPELWAATAYEGMFLGYEWDKAERALARAIAGNPQAAEPYCWQAFCLGALGRSEEAIAAASKAVELDPLSTYAKSLLGHALLGARRDHDAITALEDSLEMDADFILTHYLLGEAYAATERYQESIAIFERAVHQSDRSPFYLGLLGWVHGLADQRHDAEAILEELAARSTDGYVPAMSSVWVHTGLGDLDRAFGWLDRAIDENSWLLPQDTMYRPLHPDPRFQVVRKRIGL